MKKILISLSVILAAAAIIAGGTYAYFSDTETSIGNTFSAGTLNLTIDGLNSPLPHFTLNNVKPGDSGNYEVKFKNEGTIAGAHFFIKVLNLTDSEGLNPESETGDKSESGPGELSSNVQITVTDGTTSYFSGTLKALSLLSNGVEIAGGLAADSEKEITLSASIPGEAGNDIQGDTLSFDISAELTQN
jgi:predicted ribosomally synthesized peptide with SipW-like signal peptide